MTKIKSPKKIIYLLVALALIALIFINYISQKNNNSKPTATQTQNQSDVNLNPPTEEDRQRVEDNKQRNTEREEALKSNASNQANTSKRSVKPVITYASPYGQTIEVGGYVNGVFEEGGTCTATFSKNDHSLSKSSKATKNVNAVDCPALIANLNEFTEKGQWNLSLNYDSVTASGVSDVRVVEIK